MVYLWTPIQLEAQLSTNAARCSGRDKWWERIWSCTRLVASLSCPNLEGKDDSVTTSYSKKKETLLFCIIITSYWYFSRLRVDLLEKVSLGTCDNPGMCCVIFNICLISRIKVALLLILQYIYVNHVCKYMKSIEMEIAVLSIRIEIQGAKVFLDSCGFTVSSSFRAYYSFHILQGWMRLRACVRTCMLAHLWSVIISGFSLNQCSHFNTPEISPFLPAIH